MDQKDEIKARLPIYDLVSQYVDLKKAGRNFKGLCPFHNEKSPSFMVSPEKEIAYCFGCHQGGDIFSFYELVEGVDFSEAINVLADRVGVKLEKVSSGSSKVKKSKKLGLVKVQEEAASYFQANLADSPEVMKYLEKRGVLSDMVSEFKIGLSPDSFDQTYKHLLSKGFDKSDIVESGLGSFKDTAEGQVFDRFRCRLMFPILNKNGEVVAFGGRALKKDEPAKYLNSPETPVYNKSEILYGFYQAKDQIRRERSVIVVEGYFDQIMTYQSGLKNVVSVSGTALTQRHMSFLKRYADTVYLCFDSDGAGREAMLRAAELAYGFDLSVKVIDLGEFKDPAEMVVEDAGILSGRYESAFDLFDYLIEKDLMSLSPSEREDVEIVNKFVSEILPVASKISSSITLDIVFRKISKAIGVKIDFIYSEFESFKSKSKGKSKIENKIKGKNDGRQKYDFGFEDYFWGHMFLSPELYEKFRRLISENLFLFSQKQVYKLFEDTYNAQGNFSGVSLNDLEDNSNLRDRYSVLTLYLESVNANEWSSDQLETELKKLFAGMITRHKKVEGDRIQRDLRVAEAENDSSLQKKLLEEYSKLLSL